MASSTKHLSTHVYFHMERPVPKKVCHPPTGFGDQHTSLESSGSTAGALGNTAGSGRGVAGGIGGTRAQNQTSLRSRSKEYVPLSTAPSTNAFERLNRTLRAGLDPFQDGLVYDGGYHHHNREGHYGEMSTSQPHKEHPRGSHLIQEQRDPATVTAGRFESYGDYPSDNPYLLSPDFAARERSRRKVPWRRSRDKYDLLPSQHELQSFGVYGNRYNGGGGGTRSGFPGPNTGHPDDEERLVDDYGAVAERSAGVVTFADDLGGAQAQRTHSSSSAKSNKGSYDSHNTKVNDGKSSGRSDKDMANSMALVPYNSQELESYLPESSGGNYVADGGGSVVQERNPNLFMIIDFGENATFASQDLPSPPLSGVLELAPKEWTISQLGHQRKLFGWVREAGLSGEGMLLMNVERHCQFPFVTYLVLNTTRNDPIRIMTELEHEVRTGQTHEDHHIAGYEELSAIAKPHSKDVAISTNKNSVPVPPTSYKTGYIISAFRVFPGEDSEKLERSWLTWTGARQIYKRLPAHLGLRRIAFHKKAYPQVGITYVLMCECTTLMDYVTEACCFVDQLRARCCGYTALYRVADCF